MKKFTFLKINLLVTILLASNVCVLAADPTITVTPASIPGIAAIVGSTETETITIVGAGLNSDITLAISANDLAYFDVSQKTVVNSSGTANVQVTVSYSPQEAGSHTAILTLSSEGAASVVRGLSGISAWAPLDAPVATSSTSANNQGFTANWEAVAGVTEYQLNVYTKTVCPKLIISEYVEGNSGNKAIEIYNGTGKSVDLSAYSLKKQTDGLGLYAGGTPLSGILASGDVYVVANGLAGSEILAVKDVVDNVVTNFSGNDAIALFENGMQIDEVGVFDQLAPWGQNITLVRKSTVVTPTTFNALEWDIHAIDYTANLGSHTMNIPAATGTRLDPVVGSPFAVTGTTSSVSGLQAGTTYYYEVKAIKGIMSAPSNEISVETSATKLNNTTNLLKVTALDGKISFSAVAGVSVEIYNAIGQKLLSKLAVDGKNTIAISARGVVLVKVGNQTTKVIL